MLVVLVAVEGCKPAGLCQIRKLSVDSDRSRGTSAVFAELIAGPSLQQAVGRRLSVGASRNAAPYGPQHISNTVDRD